MVLFDLCRVYDKVWRDGLLWKLSVTGGKNSCFVYCISHLWNPFYCRGLVRGVRRSLTRSGGKSIVHLAGGRIIGGTMASLPKEAVFLEAGLIEIRKKEEERWVAELEKC